VNIDELIQALMDINEHDGAQVMVGVSPTAMREIREVRLCQDGSSHMGGKFVKIHTY
jgi:hypothetical protein